MGRRPSSKPTLLVIDGDVLLYRFSFVNQFKVNWDSEMSSEVILPFEKARSDFDGFVSRLLQATGCLEAKLAFSHALDFRFKVDPDYQSSRKKLTAPKYKEQLLEHALSEYDCIVLEWLEADDVLGLQATENPKEVLIASVDKDLCQIPGHLYNWNKRTKTFISEAEADLWFFRQFLMGDATDGIKGIPGVGPKKADAYLEDCLGSPSAEIWKYCLGIYEEHGLTAEYAMQQAHLVRILRAGEYDYQRRKPILFRGFS